MSLVGKRPYVALLDQRQVERKRKKVGASAEDALPTNDTNVLTRDLPPSKKRKKGRSGKEKVNVPLVLETLGAPDDEDPKTPVVGEDGEGPMVPEEVEEEHLEACLVDFLT